MSRNSSARVEIVSKDIRIELLCDLLAPLTAVENRYQRRLNDLWERLSSLIDDDAKKIYLEIDSLVGRRLCEVMDAAFILGVEVGEGGYTLRDLLPSLDDAQVQDQRLTLLAEWIRRSEGPLDRTPTDEEVTQWCIDRTCDDLEVGLETLRRIGANHD